MGHRTLVAYERADGGGTDPRYDLHVAHWGVDPADLAPETPFGGPPDDGWARQRAADILDAEGGRLAEDRETAVDPDPVATGLSFRAVCARIDPLDHEALYVVDADFSVRSYLVFAVRAVGDTFVALVGYDDPADAAYLRGWLAGARAVRDATAAGPAAVVGALRWLDPDRGTVVWVGDREHDA